jgi:hypothetical protein
MFRRKKEFIGGGRLSAEDLIDVLQSLFPRLDTTDEDEPGKTTSPLDLARRLVVVTLDQTDIGSASEWNDLMVFVEALLQKQEAVKPPWDQFAQNFIEDLLNAVSHGDLPLNREQVDRSFFPQSTMRAEYFDRVWVSKPGDEGPNVMDVTKYESISDSELRWLIRCMFRRTASGTYVGTGDIVRREAETGRPGGLAE